ncbi:MAG: hypothetical protein ACI8RD_008310 [Bacillariaceae sp.]|jgi:hypothetical protein
MINNDGDFFVKCVNINKEREHRTGGPYEN